MSSDLELRLIAGALFAMGGVYFVTPVAINVAARLGFYDRPAGYKGHGRPTPYLGGAAVMAGFVLALLTVTTGHWDRTLALLGGMTVLWVVGTVDDRHNIAPHWRVAVEAVLAWMLWRTGLGWDVGLGAGFDLALTVLWVVAVVNAFNLFDNMDGAASCMALAVSAGVLVMGILHHDTWLAVTAATLCGACLGFLPHNLASPARIFLGDGGSMPVGFGAAALVMVGSAEAAPAWQALIVGLLLVGVPALDTTLVMVSRRRRGVSILTGGRDHLTHRAQRRLRTARAVAIALGAVQALVSALALFAIRGGAAAIVLVVVLYFVAVATAIALLEAGERERVVSADAASALAAERRRRFRGLPPVAPSIGLVVILGIAAGASPFDGGFYDSSDWVLIGVGLLVLATAAAIARPPRLSGPALVALVSLGGLAVWSLVSSSWAPSIEQATIEGNRTFVLAAILATALILLRTDTAAGWLLGGLAAGIGAVAIYILVRLAGTDPGGLFLGGRLDQPLGYINATGTVLVMGFWLAFSLVERRRPGLAGLGAAAATLMACLAILTQSRGVALAMIVSVVVVVLLVPGDRIRRVFALLLSAVLLGAAAPTLLQVYDALLSGPLPPDVGHKAAAAALLAAVAAGVVWAAATALHQRVAARGPHRAAALRRAGATTLSIVAVAVVGVSLMSAASIQRAVSNQWTAFVSLGEQTGSAPSDPANRLISGAGNRYDYWRVAWSTFMDHPLAGVGAGNYDRPYFRARRTTEDIRQPHSIQLQTLSELGLVGGGLLAAFVGAFAVGAWRMRRAAASSPLAQTVMVASLGTFTAWLVHTSVDWMHLMPGVTAVALAMGAAMLRDREAAPAAQPVGDRSLAIRPRALAGAVVAGLALVLAAASLSRQGLADFFRDRASDALADRPADALREANQSLRLDAENPRTYYVKAAALARFNQADAAERALLQAAAKEPDDFVTWTLLGDLAVRRGRLEEAKRNYGRASALNPRDPTLAALAKDPSQAVSDSTP